MDVRLFWRDSLAEADTLAADLELDDDTRAEVGRLANHARAMLAALERGEPAPRPSAP